MNITQRMMRAARTRRAGPAIATTAVLASLAALAAGCGSSSNSNTGVAHVASTAASTTASSATAGSSSGSGEEASERERKLVAYSQCMRTHGVPEFPEPKNGHLLFKYNRGAGGTSGRGVNPESAQFKGAQAACKSLEPAQLASPAQSSEQQSSAIKFAQCMRSHGVPNFPEPKVSGGRVMLLVGKGVNPNSPQFQAATRACQKLAPGGGPP